MAWRLAWEEVRKIAPSSQPASEDLDDFWRELLTLDEMDFGAAYDRPALLEQLEQVFMQKLKTNLDKVQATPLITTLEEPTGTEYLYRDLLHRQLYMLNQLIRQNEKPPEPKPASV